MPPVLDRNPEAQLLVNDISIDVLQLWREFLMEEGLGSRVCLAAFDARDRVLRSGSIAAVSLGLDDIEHCDRAAHEVSRTLVPGGVLFTMNLVVRPRDWTRMPTKQRTEWEQRLPGLVSGYRQLVEQAGLCIEWHKIEPGRELDPDEGGLPQDAAKYGVTLRVNFEYIKARKPSRSC